MPVQPDDLAGPQGAGAQQGGPHGSGQLAGALEVQPGEGVLELLQLQQLEHHVPAHQHGVHLIGVKLVPELHQVVVAQHPLGGGLHHRSGVAVAVPLLQHLDGILQMHPVDVGADLPQGHREEVQLLIPDGLVGGHQHPPPLVELHQIFLYLHRGAGDGGPLLHPAQLLLLVGDGGDGAVVHPVEPGHRGGDGGQQVGLLHPLAHRPGHILGKEHRRVGGGEEFFHHIAAGPLHLDVEALELPLKGVQPLQGGALVLLGGILGLQHLGEGAPRLPIHPFLQLHRVKMICHRSIPSFLYSQITAVPLSGTAVPLPPSASTAGETTSLSTTRMSHPEA